MSLLERPCVLLRTLVRVSSSRRWCAGEQDPNSDALPLPRWPGNTLMTPDTIARGEDARDDLVSGELPEGFAARCFQTVVQFKIEEETVEITLHTATTARSRGHKRAMVVSRMEQLSERSRHSIMLF